MKAGAEQMTSNVGDDGRLDVYSLDDKYFEVKVNEQGKKMWSMTLYDKESLDN